MVSVLEGIGVVTCMEKYSLSQFNGMSTMEVYYQLIFVDYKYIETRVLEVANV